MRSFRAKLGAVAAGAFALRAVVALAVAPESLTHRGDPRYFHLMANMLADGHGYIAPLPFLQHGSVIASSEHPPLWSAVLAVFSVLGARSYAAHELVGCAVGAATVVCAGYLGRRVGGERAGLVAAGLTALYPVYVAMDGSLMSEPPFALCVALILLAAVRAVDAPSLRRSALLGLVLGVTVLLRGEAIALIVLVLIPVLIKIPARRLAHAGVACAVALAVFGPWVARNVATFHHPMLVSSEVGPVIGGANCAFTYSGYDLGYWRSDCLPVVHEPNAEVRSQRFTSAGVRYARRHAARLPVVEAVRVLRTFGFWQPRRHVYFAEGRLLPGRGVAVAATWVMLAFAAAGAWMMRARRTTLALLLAPAALAVLTSLLAFGYPRWRYGADVAFLVLASYAVVRLAALRSGRVAATARA